MTHRSIGLKDIYKEDVENLIDVFNHFRNTFKVIAYCLTNREWHLIRRDIKMVKRINFGDSGIWDIACAEVAALSRQECFDY